MMADELERLNKLKEQGVISDEDFEKAKNRLLHNQEPVLAKDRTGIPMNLEENTYCMLLHLSLFAGWIVPVAGLAVPIILWAIGKDKSAEIDWHGRAVLNWLISLVIYAAVCFALMFILIGVPLMFALLVISIVFPIIGAVKANNRQRYKYPLAISFISLPNGTMIQPPPGQ